jgi:hypothetical protein
MVLRLEDLDLRMRDACVDKFALAFLTGLSKNTAAKRHVSIHVLQVLVIELQVNCRRIDV